MINVAFALLFIGAVLLAAEAFIPGFGVCGISGIILIVASCVITIMYVRFGPFIVLGEIAIIGVAIFKFLDFARKKQYQGQIILRETLSVANEDLGDLESFVGKEGVTKTALKPFGMVDFNGVTIEVQSDGAYIAEHKKVKATEISQRKIMVCETNHN